jgi:hypothetical protein
MNFLVCQKPDSDNGMSPERSTWMIPTSRSSVDEKYIGWVKERGRDRDEETKSMLRFIRKRRIWAKIISGDAFEMQRDASSESCA